MKPLNPKAALPLDKYPPRLRIDQAAQFLNVTPAHVSKLIGTRALAAVNIAVGSGRADYRIDRAVLAAFVQGRKV